MWNHENDQTKQKTNQTCLLNGMIFIRVNIQIRRYVHCHRIYYMFISLAQWNWTYICFIAVAVSTTKRDLLFIFFFLWNIFDVWFGSVCWNTLLHVTITHVYVYFHLFYGYDVRKKQPISNLQWKKVLNSQVILRRFHFVYIYIVRRSQAI